MIYDIEPEFQDGRRVLSKTQELFAGTPTTPQVPNPLECSWYGTEVHPLRGAFAVVKEGAGLEDLVGEFIRVEYRARNIIVYCLGETPEVETPLALARRPFAALEILSTTSILAYTESIE